MRFTTSHLGMAPDFGYGPTCCDPEIDQRTFGQHTGRLGARHSERTAEICLGLRAPVVDLSIGLLIGRGQSSLTTKTLIRNLHLPRTHLMNMLDPSKLP
jgi:hypothetical protein